MMKIRSEQMVTMKKSYMCANKKFGNCMPMSSSQYQLSSAYFYKFQTRYPYQIYSEAANILHDLFRNYLENENSEDKALKGIEVRPGIGGIVPTVLEYIKDRHMKIDIEIPDQIIMLDPGLRHKTDEMFARIANRYQAILQSLADESSSSRNVQEPADNYSLSSYSEERTDVVQEKSISEIISIRKRSAEGK